MEPNYPGSAAPSSQDPSVPASDMAGDYTFRFTGTSLQQCRPWQLAAVGFFSIDDAGNLVGSHQGAIMPLEGVDGSLQSFTYSLTGTVLQPSSPTQVGRIDVAFALTAGNGRDMTGTYAVIPAGADDRFWLVSTGSSLAKGGTSPIELSTGEAVRLTR
jgi:hypothetical protein